MSSVGIGGASATFKRSELANSKMSLSNLLHCSCRRCSSVHNDNRRRNSGRVIGVRVLWLPGQCQSAFQCLLAEDGAVNCKNSCSIESYWQ